MHFKKVLEIKKCLILLVGWFGLLTSHWICWELEHDSVYASLICVKNYQLKLVTTGIVLFCFCFKSSNLVTNVMYCYASVYLSVEGRLKDTPIGTFCLINSRIISDIWFAIEIKYLLDPIPRFFYIYNYPILQVMKFSPAEICLFVHYPTNIYEVLTMYHHCTRCLECNTEQNKVKYFAVGQ